MEKVSRTFRVPVGLYQAMEKVAKTTHSSVNSIVVLAIWRVLEDEPWNSPCKYTYIELLDKIRALTYVGEVQKGEEKAYRQAEVRIRRNEMMDRVDDVPKGVTPWKDDPVFQSAWKAYPEVGRRRSSQKVSWKVWRKLPLTDRLVVEHAIQVEMSENKDWAGGYCKGFHRWLAEGRWKDIVEDMSIAEEREQKVEVSSHEVF